MFLKRIILHGFKSFADRTEFDFGPGMTTVVGPNGCGKSNILDAVRWVLGELSPRNLRGKTMADIIFAGSRSRKPANAAQVELTFDNSTGFLASDEPEVSIARVLYRSGDSEYRLNGNACRRKDIRNLLLDTGVGVNAYSIIEQGRVDMLLQANPIERREIFEEAAGISRYKVQRAEAQRKLERTQNNLLRLSDVLDELERQLRSVKLAAGKARRWQEHDTRLRELRASFSLSEYHELESARQEMQKTIDTLSERLQAARAELAACDAEAAEQNRALQRFDEQIQAGDAQIASLQSEFSALAERIAQSERRLSDLTALRDRRQAQAAGFTERIASLEQRIAEENAALDALAEEARHNAGKIDELLNSRDEATRHRNGARGSLESTKTAAFEAVRRFALLRNEQDNLGAQRNRLGAQAERLTARQAEVTDELDELARQQAEAAERVARLDRHTAELTEEIRQIEITLAELQATGEQLEHDIGVAKESRSGIISRLELLEEMERRWEGVDQGTQAVLGWRGGEETAGSVIGLVADLLRIDDPRVWALQSVLSSFENHVVVADTYALLSELSRRGKLPGPVQIYALDRIPVETPRANYDNAPGFIARAAEWVKCAPEYRVLTEHLLGRVIVVDEIERALALASGAPSGYVFVTLDGRTVTADGRLTAEAAQGAVGLISRKAEIRQLQQRLDEIETDLERTTRRKNELQQRLSDTQLRRSELLNQIARVQREHAEARTILTHADGELSRVRRESSVIASELESVRGGQAEIDGQVEKLVAETSVVADAQRTHETQIDTLERELTELEDTVARLSQELTEAKVTAGRTIEKKTAGEETLARLCTGRDTLQTEQAEAWREAEDAIRHIEASEAEALAARERRDECKQELERCEAELLQLRERRQTLRIQLEEGGALARELNERVHGIEAAQHECDVSLRENDVRRENLVTRIQDELQLDLAQYYQSYEHAEQDWDAIKTEIETLRGRIARLGNVNLDAITELEELTPRYENLTAQRDDLLSSIERLKMLIDELDNESRTRFTTTFEQIKEYFQELFRVLFGGGRADIILNDPELPLECGIEIIARPPGKELQSISLLSGGEKTMTAVALVMAVFKSKPSPFAFLDEVDAALDETNTERFNTMLQDFLLRSQFVVITHSKRTMQNASVLYGVTMEEPGVSKRVSVRFDDERVQTPSVA